MKIYFLAPNPKLTPNNQQRLERIGNITCLPVNRASEKEIMIKIRNADVLLISPTAIPQITDFPFDSMPNLKHLALLSSGYDWVEIKSAKDHHVSVSCCVGANAESVAEHTWGLFSVYRKESLSRIVIYISLKKQSLGTMRV